MADLIDRVNVSSWLACVTRDWRYLRILSSNIIRVFAIYQILLGWKAYKQYYETDELLNPRPTQPKKKKG